ncbi:MAG: site-specific integrase [Fibrobacter sp.]|nr:site-specific integrase [Fibrobacter sp.]
MANVKLYLDVRSARPGVPCPIKAVIRNGSTQAMIGLGISVLPSQWNSKKSVISSGSAKSLNLRLQELLLKIKNAVVETCGFHSKLKATEIRDRVLAVLNPDGDPVDPSTLFLARFLAFSNAKSGRTREIYLQTYKKVVLFRESLSLSGDFPFSEIDKAWLSSFDSWLSSIGNADNTRNLHFRNVRAVFNAAIDDGLVSVYPFRSFKLRRVETKKRYLDVDEIRRLFSFVPEPWFLEALDIFKLSFFLRGINIEDLVHLKKSDFIAGRIQYSRAKTHKMYSVKVEPEALEIIGRYPGHGDFLLDVLERYASTHNYMRRVNWVLKHRVGPVVSVGKYGRKIYEPLFPELTTYVARHSWATLCAALDIPKETISAGLGHSIGSPVTSVYIAFDQKKVDDANRRLLDWVLYNKVKK